MRIGPLLKNLDDNCNILEISSGAGRLLLQLQRMSRQKINLFANEIEFDATRLEIFQKNQITPLAGAIETIQTDVRFDLIIGVHVIEHVLDPQSVFAWISSHLNPDGVLYLETPDANALCGRIFKDFWGMTHFPRHLNIFNKTNLGAIAQTMPIGVKHEDHSHFRFLEKPLQN